MIKLPDGSGFFAADVDGSTPPGDPIKWNPGNKVVQDHRDETIDALLTNVERAKRGLQVPWTANVVDPLEDIP